MAEAPAPVLDDEAPDGGAPPSLRLLGGVLGRQVEVVQQVLLHGCTCTHSAGAERSEMGFGDGVGVREHHHLPLPPPRWVRGTGTTNTKEKKKGGNGKLPPLPLFIHTRITDSGRKRRFEKP